MKTKQIWDEASTRLHNRLLELKTKNIEYLKGLVSPVKEEIIILNKTLHLMVWTENKNGRLSVIVEGRTSPNFFGSTQVIAEGFYVSPDGVTTDMIDKDLFELGY